MSFIQCVPRFTGELYRRNLAAKSSIVAIDVSSLGEYPYNLLSPTTYAKEFAIPVPGLEGVVAHSVEGIWQGLKLIQGESNHTLFDTIAHKREGELRGYQYGSAVLDEQEARWRIFIPAYTFYLDHFAPQDAIRSLLGLQQEGKRVLLHDTKNNDDISKPEPYAHAAALATYLNLKIFNKDIEQRLQRRTNA